MTKHELKQVYYIDREIRSWKKRLDELSRRSCISAPKITGTPSGTKKSNSVEALAIQKAEAVETINGLLVELNRKKLEILNYINGINDSLIRQILTCRYIHLMSWVRTADVVGGGNTPDSVRMAHDRFLKKNENF